MLVSVVIINYNTFQLTCNCIESVIAHTHDVAYEIIVVDNASTKDNADEFLIRFPNIILVKSPDNGGFAKGNNLGIRNAKGDIVLLLNSDTILTEDSISITAKRLEKLHNPGFVTCKLVYEDGNYQHNARKYRSIRNELLDIMRPILWLLSYRTRSKLMLNQHFKGDFDTSCDWVSGAYMMFYKTLLHYMPENKLDERFFMYGEDMLWCYQANTKGFTNYFLSGTTVIHIANASTEPSKQLRLMETMVNHDLQIIRLQRDNTLYYHILKTLYVTKEKARLYIKNIAFILFGKRIR